MSTKNKVTIIGAVYGFSLALLGYTVFTWQFWLLFSIFLLFGYVMRAGE